MVGRHAGSVFPASGDSLHHVVIGFKRIRRKQEAGVQVGGGLFTAG